MAGEAAPLNHAPVRFGWAARPSAPTESAPSPFCVRQAPARSDPYPRRKCVPPVTQAKSVNQ